ncbi:MAG: cytidylate kinase-like family protein [Chloroflexota bacterium]
MGVITISRQMGSRGDELAQQVAERLGWQQVGQDLINRAALAAGAPQVALAEIDELGFFNLRPTAVERQVYQSHVERIIRELADEGNIVIVGRGGQVILSGWPNVFHVRIVAPLDARIAWLQQEHHISAEAARARLEKSNQSRARYLWRNYSRQLDDPDLYHLVINTAFIPLTQAVNVLVNSYLEWTTA